MDIKVNLLMGLEILLKEAINIFQFIVKRIRNGFFITMLLI